MADSAGLSMAASSELSPSYQHVTVKMQDGDNEGEPLTFQPESLA